MSEPTSPSPQDHEATEDPKGGPANPHRSSGSGGSSGSGLDAPTPPGGPQRQDAAGTEKVPDGRDAENRVRPEVPSGHPIPIEEEQSHPERNAGSDSSDLQEENAATSLDQPSEDLG